MGPVTCSLTQLPPTNRINNGCKATYLSAETTSKKAVQMLFENPDMQVAWFVWILKFSSRDEAHLVRQGCLEKFRVR